MKISVITVCKDSSKQIEVAMKSVVDQTYKDLEYIIIDGNSADNTMKVINHYKSDIDLVISEPDKGIYNAMNKALRYVNGDLIYFLNSDDKFFDNNILSDIENEFKKNINADIIYGNVVINTKNKPKVIKYNRIDKKFFYKNTICHQALFIKKDLFNFIGNYNEDYPIHADVDWLMKAFFKYKVKFHYFDRNICYYSSEGFSSNPIYAEKYKYDRQKISAKYFLEAKIKLGIKQSFRNYWLKMRKNNYA
jgi:glycosyltransferase involved in cell wall biosynthesis